jgi:transcriptional regulator with XRE-family HTH domain
MERPWITSPTYMAALRVLVEARKARGLSQRTLADRLGKPRSFVSKIENRERRLDFVEFVAIARALDLEPTDLMANVVTAIPGELEF